MFEAWQIDLRCETYLIEFGLASSYDQFGCFDVQVCDAELTRLEKYGIPVGEVCSQGVGAVCPASSNKYMRM